MAESRWPEREAIAIWVQRNADLFKEPPSPEVLLQLEPGVVEARLEVQGWLIEARSEVVVLKEVLQSLVNAIDATGDPMRPIYASAMVHGVMYEGPTYKDELAAARKILDPKGGG